MKMTSKSLLEHVNKMKSSNFDASRKDEQKGASKNPAAVAVMTELFIRLKAITRVGHAFSTKEQEAITMQEWMIAFREAGIKSQAKIDDGLYAIRMIAAKSAGVVWFPTAGEFIALCLGNANVLEMAQSALDRFNNGEKQIENVGSRVVKCIGYQIKTMKAETSNKLFIEKYVLLAEIHKIKPLEAKCLPKSVQLTPEQEKDAKDRANKARLDCVNKFSDMFEPLEKGNENPVVKIGVSVEKHFSTKSQAEIDRTRQEQLKKAKLKMNGAGNG
jgi:hypothetical protein